MTADVQRELAVEALRGELVEIVGSQMPRGHVWNLDKVTDGVQRLIADAEKRAAAAARDHGRMVGAYETFASLASNLRHGTTFTAEDMDRLAAEYRSAAALDPAGAASGETT